ncbi:MAG: pyridoxal phosphate-dependent aminotransferase [Erysipelotrichaceae bacterium]|jgi:aspartate/tyrosine/aromatic aminotransferase
MEKENIRKEIAAVDDMLSDLFEKRITLAKKESDLIEKEKFVLTVEKGIKKQDVSMAKKQFNNQLDNLSAAFINRTNDNNDLFLNDNADFSVFKDSVFELRTLAKKAFDQGNKDAINATIGSFFDEDKKIITLNTVYDCYNAVSNATKAAYAKSITGNEDFNETIFNWINQNNNISLYHKTVAAAGGTGALTLAFNNFLNPNETVLLPQTSWGSYKTIARNANLKCSFYKLTDENNQIDLQDLMLKALKIIREQGKLFVVINDPCQNPTGISLGSENWKLLIKVFNKITENGPIIIVNDVAYIDYCYNNGYDIFKCFNEANEKILFNITYSCSKAFTAYGMRLGANIILSKNKQAVDNAFNAFTRTCRSYWSNVNHGFMEAVVKVLKENKEKYLREKQHYIDLLKERSEIFLNMAKKADLPLYPYSEGFFATVKVEDDEILNRFHNNLIARNIFAVKFDKGIRISLCAITKEEAGILPKLLKETLEASK